VSRVVLIDEVGDVDAARAALAAHPDVTVQRADTLPAGDDVVGLLVGTEVPVGARELAALPAVRIVAATATGYDHLALAEIQARAQLRLLERLRAGDAADPERHDVDAALGRF